MILRSIHVAGWRCFADRVEVGPFGEGVNVLYAPNATGKSTLFEALLRGLLDGHRVSGQEVEALRPWGRVLGPSVTIEFSHTGTAYRLKKRFLDDPISELERFEDGRYVRLAEGYAADEQARNVLTGSPPGRGLSRPENWGLAQVLWAPQGNLALAPLSGDLVATIRESLGAQISGPGTGSLEERIEGAFFQFFTPTGKLRTGKEASRLVRLRDHIEKCQAERQAAVTRLEIFQQASRKVEDLRARRAQARRDTEALSNTLRQARAQSQAYSALLAESGKREEQVKSAQARHSELKQHTDAIAAVRKELNTTKEELAQLQSDLPVHAREVETREGEAAKCKKRLEDAKKTRAKAENARRAAEAARRLVEAQEQLTQAEELVQKTKAVMRALKKQKTDRTGVVAPDTRTLRAVRKALKSRDDAQVRLDAALITLEITPEETGTLEIFTAEKTGKRKLSPRTPIEIKGAPEVAVELKGIARIRARGPTGPVEDLRQQINKAIQKIEELTAGFGTADIEILETFHERAKTLEEKISESETRLETLLSGRSVEEIEQQRTRLANVVEEILGSHHRWRNNPPNLESLVVTAEEIERSCTSAFDQAQVSWEKAESALRAASDKHATLQANLAGARRRVESLTAREHELTDDGRNDRQRGEEARKLALEWEAAREAHKEVTRKLSDYGGDPREAVARLEKQLKAAEEAATKALEAEKEEEGRLQQLSAEGPYSTLCRVEEELAKLEEETAREELHANAVHLLYTTISQCRTEALAHIAKPVEEVSTQILHRIAGTRLGKVCLSDALHPHAVVPSSVETEVTVGELSGGEKEQIHFAVRLALADAIAQEDRELVVLDDVLTVTDAGRFARLLSVIEEASERLQILVLTCHPEWYRALDGAQFFDLEAMLTEPTASQKPPDLPGQGAT